MNIGKVKPEGESLKMEFTFEDAQDSLKFRAVRPLILMANGCWQVEEATKPPRIYPSGFTGGQLRLVRWLGAQAGKWPLQSRTGEDRIYPIVCENHLCVNPNHWGKKVPAPRYRRNRKGRKQRSRVISDQEIYEIHIMREGGATYGEIAERYMIGRSTVGSIVNEHGSYADFWERWSGR